VKCYYDAPEQRLTVEILHAADLIALDANGKLQLHQFASTQTHTNWVSIFFFLGGGPSIDIIVFILYKTI